MKYSLYKKQIKVFIGTILISSLCFGGCGFGGSMDYTVNYDNIECATSYNDKIAVHDPSIVKDNGIYYLFGTHMSAAKSTDLSNWEMMTNGYSVHNKVYTDLKNYDSGEFAFTGGTASVIPTDDKNFHVWAPDVIYNKKLGKYFMYQCTSSTFNASTIVYAVSDQMEGPYEWQGNLIYSGFTTNNIDQTDVLSYVDREEAINKYTSKAGYEYNYKEYPNALDPTVFYDENERLWMVYGSWSGGIFLIELDENTGKVIHPKEDEKNQVDAYFGKRLMGGGHHSIEGPYILWDEPSGYYYLYVSYGELKRDGGYQIRVFRSENVDGPYVDMNGNAPDKKTSHQYMGLKLSGNYYLPCLPYAYKATGHNSAMLDEDGKRYIAYHTRFDKGTEAHTPKVKQYFLNEEGWPCMLPYSYSGEIISEIGYEKKELVGRYYVVNQGIEIDESVAEPFVLYFTEDGSVKGENITGSWTYQENSYYMHFSYEENEYSGVFCQMKDEAGTDVMTFTAVGSNESVWGVKY